MSPQTPANNTPRIAFIGAGNMAGALIGGMIAQSGKDLEQKSGEPAAQTPNIIASDPYAPSLETLSQRFAIQTARSNSEAVRNADVVILAVKPQVLRAAIAEFATELPTINMPLFISIAAGISMRSLQTWLGESAPIVRCMPNTPALIQLGATGLFANSLVTDQLRSATEKILGAVGISSWVKSDTDLDAITAISGSGPAYFFAVIEAMQNTAISMGLSPELAEQFVKQTALGATRMAMDSDVDVAELRRRVTSPGGTTQAALKSFEENGLQVLFDTALTAAKDRAVEMADELGE